MKYTLFNGAYSSLDIIKLNTLKERSYFIPYSNKKHLDGVSLLDKRYKSDKVLCLSGKWDFKHFTNPNLLKCDFDSSDIEFESIDVPSSIQYRGFEKPEYINARYNFFYNPPKIPTTKPVGLYYSLNTLFKFAPKNYYNHISLYRKLINIKKENKHYILSFLGVSSGYELYVNGSFVGYAEESHNTSEFEITPFLIDGENEIIVNVHRWSTGSYLECQDMFRNTGIFRDVLLRIEDEKDLFDIDINTYKHNSFYDLTVTLNSRIKASYKVTFNNISKDIELIPGDNEISFNDLNVKEWNAEEPTLYDLYIESDNFCVKERVGFKDIKIIGDTYLLNESYVKFRGVNHHDTSYINGYALSSSEIDRDLKICKEFNIDTIRTSHYAPDPLLLELAQEYGIYIIDEVDLETHGVFFQRLPISMNWISSDKRFINSYLSRAKSHFNRDKIHKTSIVMWSLGNEAGGGICMDKMYEYFKSVTNIPIHYEGVTHHKTKAYDIASSMYPKVSDVKLVGLHESKISKFNDRPYFLCEYAHAMGVGPGNIEGYLDTFYSYVNLIGGCIWEMVDHGVKTDGIDIKYGGDNNEFIHDSNFCCDGLFYPDRTPSNGAWLAKYAYRPIIVKHLDGAKYQIFNTRCFTRSSEYKIIFKDSTGEHIINTDIAPLNKTIIEFNTNDKKIDCYVYDKNNLLRSEESIVLDNTINKELDYVKGFPDWFKIDNEIYFRENGFRVNLNKPFNTLFRAETDNDSKLFILKPMRKWYNEKEEIVDVKKLSGKIIVTYKIKAAFKTFTVTDTYEALRNGVLCTSVLESNSKRGYIPRFSKVYKFDKSFNIVTYNGREKESYIDMRNHSRIGEFTKSVADMTEPNIKPQESGNRMDTSYVEVKSRTGMVRFSAIKKPFELQVKPYSDSELTKMKHRSDEVNTGTYVAIGCFNQGIGTGSCGPETLKEHKFSVKNKYTLKYMIEVSSNEKQK